MDGFEQKENQKKETKKSKKIDLHYKSKIMLE